MDQEMSNEDSGHYVQMPWEDTTVIHHTEMTSQGDVTTTAVSRWNLIQRQLRSNTPILDFEMLCDVIRSYNVIIRFDGTQENSTWAFRGLGLFFETMDPVERYEFFKEGGLLSMMRHLCLELERMVPRIPILRSGQQRSIKLHQMEVACLLANAFLCTFPQRKTLNLPSINFGSLFQAEDQCVVEKIKCIVNYFKRIHLRTPIGSLSFHRLCIPEHKFPRWERTRVMLTNITVEVDGRIEDQADHLQMDFANRYVGGGVLGRGCVQEEIRFAICPELIIARLFTECLKDNEALLIKGAERFCQYTGYAKTFKFTSDFEDQTPMDSEELRKTQVIVLDALHFSQPPEQYREGKILRELKKAFVGFHTKGEENLPVATGNWGCGAFRGDPQLKSLLQIMAASQANRNILYITFGDLVLKEQLQEVYNLLQINEVYVGMLYRILRVYHREKLKNQTVFEFVKADIHRRQKQGLLSQWMTNVLPTNLHKNKGTTHQPEHQEQVSIEESMMEAEEVCTSRIRQILANHRTKATEKRISNQAEAASKSDNTDEKMTEVNDSFGKKMKCGDSRDEMALLKLYSLSTLEDKDQGRREGSKSAEARTSYGQEESALLRLYSSSTTEGKPPIMWFEAEAQTTSATKKYGASSKKEDDRRDSTVPVPSGKESTAICDDATPEAGGSGPKKAVHSPSLFSDSDGDSGPRSPSPSLLARNRNKTATRTVKTERKLSQTKITDCFFKK